MTKIRRKKKVAWGDSVYSLNTPQGGFLYLLHEGDRATMLSASELRARAEIAGIQIYRPKDDPTTPCEFEKICQTVQELRRVDAVLAALAGRRAGVHSMGGGKIFVLSSPELIEPRPADPGPDAAMMDAEAHGWPLVFEVLRGRLTGVEDDGGESVQFDQTRQFLVWTWHAVRSLYEDLPSSGLALGLIGGPGTGKSLLISVLTWCLGGRVSRPFRYLAGLDGVNDDFLGSMLGVIDDELSDSNPRAVEGLIHGLKQIVAVASLRLRKHYSAPLEVSVSCRLVLAANDEPDCLAAMPKVRSDTEDKLLYLKVYKADFPVPCETLEERAEFQKKLKAEIPVFIHWLLNVFKPERDELGRFGAKAWQHPAIVEQLGAFDPCERTLLHLEALIRSGVSIGRADLERVSAADAARLEAAILKAGGAISGIVGSAGEIRSKLLEDDGPLSSYARREVRAAAYFGRDLNSLQSRLGSDVLWQTKSRQGGTRRWVLLGEGLR